MQPTTDTPFERFAFASAALLIIVLTFLSFGLTFLMVAVFPANVERFVFGCVNTAGWVIAFGLIFCIICAIKIERDHLAALVLAEAELSDIIVSDMRTLPQNWEATGTVFIVESVVIANDYLRALRWVVRKLVGGESKSLSRLLARARREATVRVLRKAKECGANVVWNIRYETSAIQSIFSSDAQKSVTGVEILAFATAFNVTAE
jgi:uncharacterized protein YbjQ (UPF0145 family)